MLYHYSTALVIQPRLKTPAERTLPKIADPEVLITLSIFHGNECVSDSSRPERAPFNNVSVRTARYLNLPGVRARPVPGLVLAQSHASLALSPALDLPPHPRAPCVLYASSPTSDVRLLLGNRRHRRGSLSHRHVKASVSCPAVPCSFVVLTSVTIYYFASGAPGKNP